MGRQMCSSPMECHEVIERPGRVCDVACHVRTSMSVQASTWIPTSWPSTCRPSSSLAGGGNRGPGKHRRGCQEACEDPVHVRGVDWGALQSLNEVQRFVNSSMVSLKGSSRVCFSE